MAQRKKEIYTRDGVFNENPVQIRPNTNNRNYYDIYPQTFEKQKPNANGAGKAAVNGLNAGAGVTGALNLGAAALNGLNVGGATTAAIRPSVAGSGGYGGYGGYLATYNPYAAYNSPYQPQIDELLKAMMNRNPFSYDYLSDPVYQSYRQQYEFQGDRARENAIGDYARNTGGLASSWATTAGQLRQNNYNAQLNSLIPELENAAYNRYMGEYEQDLNNMNVLQNLENENYNRYLQERDYDLQMQQLNNAARASYARSAASGSRSSAAASTPTKADLSNGAYLAALEYMQTGQMPDLTNTGITAEDVLGYVKTLQALNGGSTDGGLLGGAATATAAEDTKKKKSLLQRWAEAYGKSGASPIY